MKQPKRGLNPNKRGELYTPDKNYISQNFDTLKREEDNKIPNQSRRRLYDIAKR